LDKFENRPPSVIAVPLVPVPLVQRAENRSPTALPEPLDSVTVAVAVPTREPVVAVTVTVPGAFAVSRPPDEMMAVGLGLGVVAQEMAAGQAVALPSLFRQPAVNCRVCPAFRTALEGVTKTEVAGPPEAVTLTAAVPTREPTVAVT
jgi:hypothetical protein